VGPRSGNGILMTILRLLKSCSLPLTLRLTTLGRGPMREKKANSKHDDF